MNSFGREFSLFFFSKDESIDDVVKILQENAELFHRWAYILHDKDGVCPHYHLYVSVNANCGATDVDAFFDIFMDVSRLRGSCKDFLNYCLNRSPATVGRYQYDVSGIVANFNVAAELKRK